METRLFTALETRSATILQPQGGWHSMGTYFERCLTHSCTPKSLQKAWFEKFHTCLNMPFWRNKKQVQIVSPNSVHDALSLSTETPCSPLNCLPTLSPPLLDVLDVQSHSCVSEKHTETKSSDSCVLCCCRWAGMTQRKLPVSITVSDFSGDSMTNIVFSISCQIVRKLAALFVTHVHLSSIWVTFLRDSSGLWPLGQHQNSLWANKATDPSVRGCNNIPLKKDHL